jgi:EAL domain-containing protein (putative c-di-GMP-specific phosphodiesterase class I)
MTIENINMIQSSLDVSEINQMFLHLGEIFMAHFPRNAYILSINRLAAIGRSVDEVKLKSASVLDDIKKLSSDINSIIPIPIENCSAAIEFKKEDNDYDSMMDLINNMLVRAKASQLKNLQICDESVFADRERKRCIYKILRRELTLESEQFQVWFQPIYSINGKKFEYMEALSRLKNTELGDIPPQEFVQVAESRGLIELLGFVAFEKVCKFISDNRDTVNAVSINFSVYQMMNPNVVKNVLDTIERFSLSPSNIVMEITESIFIDNYELVMKHMMELAQAGVKFYLDDFGTGYSNLMSIFNLKFEIIKIDKSILWNADDNIAGDIILENTVNTIKQMDRRIVCEGVETSEQRDKLTRMGVDYCQGYLFSRPVTDEEFLTYVEQFNFHRETTE